MTEFDWWHAAEEKKRTGEHVQAEVYDANKGGLIVKLLGLRAFLPAKLTAVGADGNWAALVGKHIEVRILEVNRRRKRVIVCQVPWKGELDEDPGDG
jgi:ribosomal protein S1